MQAICDEILIISKGKLVAFDKPENLEKLLMASNEVFIRAEASAGEIIKILNRTEHVSGWEMKEIGEELTEVLIRTEEGDIRDICRKLFFDFAQMGKALLEMTVKKASLEDVFIELTESEVQQQ